MAYTYISHGTLTEDQIERRVQGMVDRLDARYVRDASMTKIEYDSRHAEINAWADMQYRILDRSKPGSVL